jgi:predicted Na+-dependent transporter
LLVSSAHFPHVGLLADLVSVGYCAATKTLALGTALIAVIYSGQSNEGLLALPLICFSTGQMLQGNLLIEPLKRYARTAL